MKKLFLAGLVALGLASCSQPADVVSANISKAADNFEINRRIIFYNGITGGYMLTIEGLCSIGNYDKSREVTITCRTGYNEYKKHFLGLSDNVTYFSEQPTANAASPYFYRVTFNPTTIIPDIRLPTP